MDKLEDIVLFLDVDGVLNTHPETRGLMPTQLAELRKIIENCNPSVVVSSDWRHGEDRLQQIRDVLEGMKARFGGITPRVSDTADVGCKRAAEIAGWLAINALPDRFVILDDTTASEFGDLQEHVVQTNPQRGLVESDVVDAIKKLSQA